ncbi:hypothetical protein QC762_611660 [Podospora pseudocomata]|uniref:Uncharacterized protein n=1 Tax=Podospora pseudocomata TaxID=2093779 RepID=A0ABR0G5Z5_9PEZI|nr:hypothetical protein QC762_611660 [Podospora pseudocomata]
MAAFAGRSCNVIPESIASDAGVAGAGVLLSSTITAFLVIGMAASLILQDVRWPRKCIRNPSIVRRKLLSGYSDQQILVGIGLQSVGLVKSWQLSPYHFFIIWMLSLLSMATHNATLLSLINDFKRDWVLRWMRQLLMFLNLLLSIVYGVFLLQAKIKDLPDTLPIACAWTRPSDTTRLGGLDVVATVVVVALNCLIFGLATWYLQSRRQKSRAFRVVQAMGIVAMAGIAFGATTRAYLLSQAFGTPDVLLSDEGEKTWSFGQLLGMLMLLLPVISIIEIKRGDASIAPPVPDDVYSSGEDSQERLVGRELAPMKA